VEEAILNYCTFNGSRFKAAYVVNWIMEKGLLAGESSRLKLLKRVHDAIQRLARRGLVRRVAHGYYMLTASVEELASRLKPARAPSLIKGSKEIHGTRVPAGGGRGGVGGGGCGVGLYLDNLRGYTSSGYVGGDRGAVRGFGDLVFFERVSYSEFAVGLGTSLLQGLGQVVLYYSCKEVPGVGVVCSDWFEWRPPRGFIKRYGVLEARRVFVNRVVPLVFGLVGRAAVIASSPFKVLAGVVHGLARSLYSFLRRGCSNGV